MNYNISRVSSSVNALISDNNEYSRYKGIVYIDRDGVLIEDYGYVGSAKDVKLITGAKKFLTECKKNKYLIAIITNQSGIGRGYYNWEDYYHVTNEMLKQFGDDIIPSFIVACSKNPEEKSRNKDLYRKPEIGMIEYIRQQIGIRIFNEILIGDKASDIECGIKANIKCIAHVLTGYGIGEKEKVNNLKILCPRIKTYNNLGEINITCVDACNHR